MAADTVDLAHAWRSALRVPDRRPIYEWAHDNVELPPVLTKTGRFDVSGSRQMIAPFDALKADQVREVNVLANVRGAKTLIADVFVPWAIENDNASILWTFQKDDIAKGHAELRIMPILEKAPGIKALMPLDRYKKRTQEIIFANGLPLYLTGPSVTNLQSRGFKIVICDEPWMDTYKPGTLKEARGRLGDFLKQANSKFLCISQGGEPDSDWDLQWQSGVIHQWHVPCLSRRCRRMIAPVWTGAHPDGRRHGVRFDLEKQPDGRYDERHALSTLRYECPHCGFEHPDEPATRAAWNEGGAYFDPEGRRVDARYEFPEYSSFRWWAIIDYPWRELVHLWLEARHAASLGDFTATIIFCQKYLAEMKSEANVHENEQNFPRVEVDRDRDIKELSFPGAVIRFMTADRQEADVYWVTIRDWADGTGESLRVFFGKLYSEAEIRVKQIEYDVGDDCVVIDSGYRPKGDQGVYAACIRYGWIAVKGDDPPSGFFWHLITNPENPKGPKLRVQRPFAPPTLADPFEGDPGGRQGTAGCCYLIRFASSSLADRVQALIEKGLWMEPLAESADEVEKEYARQMSSEFKRRGWNARKMRFEDVWVCPSGNNHAFDCSKMQVLCAMNAGLLPAGLGMADGPEGGEDGGPKAEDR